MDSYGFESVSIGRAILLAKLANGRTVLSRAAREHPPEMLDQAPA